MAREDAVRDVIAAFVAEDHHPPFRLQDFVRAFGGSDVAVSLSDVDAWTDVPPSAFQGGAGRSLGPYLGFMEADMFRAFVAAWMVEVLRNGDADQDAVAMVIVSLDPGLSLTMWGPDRFVDRKDAMTVAERRAVVTFGNAIAGDPALTAASGHDPGPVIAAAWSG